MLFLTRNENNRPNIVILGKRSFANINEKTLPKFVPLWILNILDYSNIDNLTFDLDVRRFIKRSPNEFQLQNVTPKQKGRATAKQQSILCLSTTIEI